MAWSRRWIGMMDDSDSDEGGGPARPGPVPSVEGLARAAIARLAHEGGVVTGLSEEAVEAFCALLVAGDYRGAERMLTALTAKRQNYARIADGLLSEAARRVGTQWEQDKLSFGDVSVAIAQIFRLNQAFRRRHVPIRRKAERLALFVTLPGQSHNLGLVLAAEAFRAEGWQVEVHLDAPMTEVLDAARRLRPELVGLTISREDKRHQLELLTAELRALPLRVRIMLGGRGAEAFARHVPAGRIDRVVTDIASALAEA
jgi:methanogenic corrinoid protein MtbC1